MLQTLERNPGARLLFVGRPLPDGSQVLVPRVVLPRTCRRLDGVAKLAYATRAEAKAAATKHHIVYRCTHCASFHLASKG